METFQKNIHLADVKVSDSECCNTKKVYAFSRALFSYLVVPSACMTSFCVQKQLKRVRKIKNKQLVKMNADLWSFQKIFSLLSLEYLGIFGVFSVKKSTEWIHVIITVSKVQVNLRYTLASLYYAIFQANSVIIQVWVSLSACL